ncbi:dihydrodipicolinate synthase family protein [uncultured Ruegeria sp.]|uniref:dihydrodipicolinate synthase family protein n=1 Tax=uncultured Ruegeria sp. TaxID=259304 RepID=UPI00262CD418|nr:dihydrodipicolinate synthase family protein [uncultured Ruegeria sp.]
MSVSSELYRGVFPILPTPFTSSGAVDVESQARLIRHHNNTGVHGVCVLGFMGEAHNISDAERKEILSATRDNKSKELVLWSGIRALGTIGAVQQAQEAEAYGIDAVYVAPLPVQNDEAQYQHYKSVSEAVSIPVAIHDYPGIFGGIKHSPELIKRLVDDEITPYIKLEDEPVGPKTSKLRCLVGDRIGIFGGLGAVYMAEEMERGANGIMSGFSFPEVLIRIFNLFESGNHDEANRVFDTYASVFRYEFQPGLGLSFRKHVYNKMGIITSDFIRSPSPVADNFTLAEYERVLARTGLHLNVAELDAQEPG